MLKVYTVRLIVSNINLSIALNNLYSINGNKVNVCLTFDDGLLAIKFFCDVLLNRTKLRVVNLYR